MRKIAVGGAILAGALAVILPTGAFAHRGPSHQPPSTASRSVRSNDTTSTGSTTSTAGTTSTSTSTAAPKAAGAVKSYANGVLTIQLNDGSTVAGAVSRHTRLRWASSSSRRGRGHRSGRSSYTLSAGETVLGAGLAVVPSGATWAEVVVVAPTTTTGTTSTTTSSSTTTT